MMTTMLERIGSHSSPLRSAIFKAWRRYALRSVGANDNHPGLDRLYALPDPWDMESATEQSRFAQTNAVLDQLAGRVGSILEVGSGEGHQSKYLSQLCERLYGFDVSERAITRARAELPQCHFGVGHLSALPWTLAPGEKYDLVVACEVLYYLGDVEAAVREMSRLGRRCFASFFASYACAVAQHLEHVTDARRGWIFHNPCAWLWVYWTSESGAAADFGSDSLR